MLDLTQHLYRETLKNSFRHAELLLIFPDLFNLTLLELYWHGMQLCVMNNAAFMEVSVIMESANSVVLTMLATHAETAQLFLLVS